jgi:hypothetical protein
MADCRTQRIRWIQAPRGRGNSPKTPWATIRVRQGQPILSHPVDAEGDGTYARPAHGNCVRRNTLSLDSVPVSPVGDANQTLRKLGGPKEPLHSYCPCRSIVTLPGHVKPILTKWCSGSRFLGIRSGQGIYPNLTNKQPRPAPKPQYAAGVRGWMIATRDAKRHRFTEAAQTYGIAW